MRTRGARWNLAVAVALLAAAVAAPSGFSQGSDETLGISPVRHEIPDAQSGQTYQRNVLVMNQFDSESTISVSGEGEAGGWTTTQPASGFVMPPRTERTVTLSIAVPAGTAEGAHAGSVRFLTEAKATGGGTGSSVRHGAAVTLEVTVGGAAVVALRWVDAEARDVVQGSPANVSARVANDGNVASTARARVEILGFDDDAIRQQGEGNVSAVPGQVARLAFPLTEPLPVGQYRARVTGLEPAGFVATHPFKVVEPSSLGKNLVLRGFVHEAFVPTGQPAEIRAWYENTGNLSVESARLFLTIRSADVVVAQLQSEPQSAAPGTESNLSVVFSPASPAIYNLTGYVEYDGFRTPEQESVLNVQGPARTVVVFNPLWLAAALAIVALLILLLWAATRRRDDESDDRRPRP